MRIERLSKHEGEHLATALQERHDLEGTYELVQRPEDPGRYAINPARGDSGEFRVMVGRHPRRGRITLLVNTVEAVVMIDATSAPL
jgi:hypothetical protein